MSRLLAVIASVALLSVLALAAVAGAAAPRTTLPDVEDEVMCVVCGTPLNLAEAPQADRERALIQRLIDQGLTKEQIKRRLEVEYGPPVLALPKSEGFDAAVYIVPIAVVGLALLALALTVPRWRRARQTGAVAGDGENAASQPTAAEVRRLDDELARFEG